MSPCQDDIVQPSNNPTIQSQEHTLPRTVNLGGAAAGNDETEQLGGVAIGAHGSGEGYSETTCALRNFQGTKSPSSSLSSPSGLFVKSPGILFRGVDFDVSSSKKNVGYLGEGLGETENGDEMFSISVKNSKPASQLALQKKNQVTNLETQLETQSNPQQDNDEVQNEVQQKSQDSNSQLAITLTQFAFCSQNEHSEISSQSTSESSATRVTTNLETQPATQHTVTQILPTQIFVDEKTQSLPTSQFESKIQIDHNYNLQDTTQPPTLLTQQGLTIATQFTQSTKAENDGDTFKGEVRPCALQENKTKESSLTNEPFQVAVYETDKEPAMKIGLRYQQGSDSEKFEGTNINENQYRNQQSDIPIKVIEADSFKPPSPRVLPEQQCKFESISASNNNGVGDGETITATKNTSLSLSAPIDSSLKNGYATKFCKNGADSTEMALNRGNHSNMGNPDRANKIHKGTDKNCVEDSSTMDIAYVANQSPPHKVSDANISAMDADSNEFRCCDEIEMMDANNTHTSDVNDHMTSRVSAQFISSSEYTQHDCIGIYPTSAANKLETDDILNGQRAINPPVHNPYASSRKRNIHQLTKRTSSNTIDLPISTASPDAIASAVSAGPTTTPLGRRVVNPYAKASCSALPRSIVRNPYCSSGTSIALERKPPGDNSSSATAMASTMINRFSNKEELSKNSERNSNISVKTQTHEESKQAILFGQRGISHSLPMVERLPSRNVSFRSAEILTVGELYRYLYEPINGDSYRQGQIISVRVTGTLLCVSRSPATHDSDASGSAMYNKGAFLIVGDPLERIQNSVTSLASTSHQKSYEDDSFQQDRKNTPHATPSTKTTSRTLPSSILRNKKTPTQMTTTALFATPKSKLAPAKAISRGLQNTGAKKKFVYVGITKKSQSSLLSGGVSMKKFSTPTRVKLKEPGAIQSTIGNDTDSTTKRANPMMRSFGRQNGLRAVAVRTIGMKGENPQPEQVIECHSSPMVPIWIGPSFEGDGLDGSVVGDLVLIMGEIVNDICSSCNLGYSRDNSSCSTSEEDDDNKESNGNNTSFKVKGVKDAAKFIADRASSVRSKSNRRKSNSCECSRFVCARFVKNANGTDMNLLKESLEVRRQYIANRKRQLEMFVSSNQNLYSVGLGIRRTND